ncbi:MAG: hypothetical protein QM723_11205 [Myxococcaceae bacterium]
MKKLGLMIALLAANAWAQADGGADQSPVTPVTTITTTGSEPVAVPVGAPEVPQPIVDPNAPWYTRFTPYGYLKVGAFYNFPPLTDQTTNSNDGFRLAALRLGTTFRPMDRLTVVASIEAAAPQQMPSAVPEGARIVQMRDAYAEYKVCSGFLVRAGQFKAPVWAETLLDDHMLPFVYRSAIADGYGAPDYNSARPGLALDRQVGLMVSSEWLGKQKVAEVRYAIAIVNGNGYDQFLNDNNHVAPVARVEARLFEHITVGMNGFFNQVTTGTRPYRITDNQLGYGGDISANALGFSVMVGYLGRQSSYSSGALVNDSASGLLGQVHFGHEGTGLEGAVRLTIYDPSHADPTDDITEISAMLGWRMKSAPLRVLVQYTHREEAQGVSVPNDGLDAMLQVTW